MGKRAFDSPQCMLSFELLKVPKMQSGGVGGKVRNGHEFTCNVLYAKVIKLLCWDKRHSTQNWLAFYIHMLWGLKAYIQKIQERIHVGTQHKNVTLDPPLLHKKTPSNAQWKVGESQPPLVILTKYWIAFVLKTPRGFRSPLSPRKALPDSTTYI